MAIASFIPVDICFSNDRSLIKHILNPQIHFCDFTCLFYPTRKKKTPLISALILKEEAGCFVRCTLTNLTPQLSTAAESLHWKKKRRKSRSQSKTMRAHDAQLAPSVSNRSGVFPPGGFIACVCAPNVERRTTGI